MEYDAVKLKDIPKSIPLYAAASLAGDKRGVVLVGQHQREVYRLELCGDATLGSVWMRSSKNEIIPFNKDTPKPRVSHPKGVNRKPDRKVKVMSLRSAMGY